MLCSVLITLLIIGCDENSEKLEWSPDGTHAAVLLRGELRLSDAAGVLSSPLAREVSHATWLPDGNGLVCIRSLYPETWKEASSLLSSDEVTTLEQLAFALMGFLESAIEATDGSFDEIGDKFFTPLKIDSSEKLAAVLACLSHTQAKPLKKLIGKANKKQREQIEKEFAEIRKIRLQELFTLRLDANHFADIRSLLCTADSLSEARPSPNARSVAFVRESVLHLTTLDDKTTPFNTSNSVVGSIVWSPNSGSVLFASPISKWDAGKNNLSAITRLDVSWDAAEWKMGETVTIAQICSGYPPRVRVLPDGRVLFSSLEIGFPFSERTPPLSSFFIAPTSPEDKEPVKKLACRADLLPADLSAYALSPDGKRLALVASETDAVRIVTLDSGEVTTIWPKNRGKSRTLPAWRGSAELFFVALPNAGTVRPEWMQWSADSGAKIFSGHWEAEDLAPLLSVPAQE
jgi:hypothetical protein